MSDYFDDEYDDDEPNASESAPTNGGPKALRDAYEREKDARKALEERLAAIEADNKRAKLESALKGTGVDPAALGDHLNALDPEKAADQVAAWRRAFGLESGDQPAGVSAEDAAAVAAVSGEPNGTAPVTTGDDAAALAGIDNEEEFAKLMGWR